MTTDVTRTSSGDGAFIVVLETDQEIAERQQQRVDRLAALGDLDFTPGQIAFMESTSA